MRLFVVLAVLVSVASCAPCQHAHMAFIAGFCIDRYEATTVDLGSRSAASPNYNPSYTEVRPCMYFLNLLLLLFVDNFFFFFFLQM